MLNQITYQFKFVLMIVVTLHAAHIEFWISDAISCNGFMSHIFAVYVSIQFANCV